MPLNDSANRLIYIRRCPACKQLLAMRMTPQQAWNWDARWRGRATALTNWLNTFTPLLGMDMIDPLQQLVDGMALTEEEWDTTEFIDPSELDEDEPDEDEEGYYA